MNRLSTEKRAAVVAALVEGMSIRATCRMLGVSKNTVAKLLADLGAVSCDFADEKVRGVQAKRIQIDEIWAFCYSKEKNVPKERKGEFGYGDVWTWVAIDADTKLVISWMVGRRDAEHGDTFLYDVAHRVEGRPQITTDGLPIYTYGVGMAFKGQVDFAQLQKIYGTSEVAPGRYSPPICKGCKKKVIKGQPDPDHINTSYVERNMLTMRMGMRRMTRLTNAFSKKVAQLENAVSLHFMHYNFCRKHQTLGTSPAVAAGLADHVWSLGELIGLLEAKEAQDVSEK